ncbi:Zn-dependent hydrolase [Bacillus sp. 03113]|uniref:Zn-dependent hydrolase n=1 Tax=Bacillus sp. 03113 TaxID=2578211 RepID=UPI0011415DDF|nr:Zn-dependent hydrolase [Bacillus sp. 03113]
MSALSIQLERVTHHFAELKKINSGSKGYTRAAYSREEMTAKEWLMNRLQALNVPVKLDAAKNVIARFGPDEGPALAFGSHLDTVIEGGLYDGALGVIAGLEIIETLVEQSIELPIPIELICFTGEEANPLGGTFGSRAMAGIIEPSLEYEDKLKEFGFDSSSLLEARRSKSDFLCYLELHIEQGEVLEKNNQSIGIVTSIAGMIRFQVKIIGRASHSGTTPMNLRNDALVQAAQVIQAVNEIAKSRGEDIVATVGEISIFPNMANVVPGEAELLVEVRGSEWGKMKDVEREITEWIKKNIKQTETSTIVEKKPNIMEKRIQTDIEKACEMLGLSYRYMLSGANHDANSMSHLTETGMIFVQSHHGISHHPDEYTSWEEIEKGINVMLHTVCSLANQYAIQFEKIK